MIIQEMTLNLINLKSRILDAHDNLYEAMAQQVQKL